MNAFHGRCISESTKLASALHFGPVKLLDAFGRAIFRASSRGLPTLSFKRRLLCNATGGSGFRDGNALYNASFNGVGGLHVSREGEILVADACNHGIRKLTRNVGDIEYVVNTVMGRNGKGDEVKCHQSHSCPLFVTLTLTLRSGNAPNSCCLEPSSSPHHLNHLNHLNGSSWIGGTTRSRALVSTERSLTPNP